MWLAMVGVLLPPPARAAVDPAGLWLTQDADGVVAVTHCGAALCAHVAGITLDHPDDPIPRDADGGSRCGAVLVRDGRQTEPGVWTGHITDPRDGSTYRMRLWLDGSGRLHLRGYLLIPLLGRSVVWTRFAGRVPPDCRMPPNLATLPPSQPAGENGHATAR
jgi:uncharacterized protein (DUF2147 family)